MSSEPAVDSKTQVGLFKLRAGARRVDRERRSAMNETTDLSEIADAEITARQREAQYLQSERRLSNAEEAIANLLKQNTAYQRTVARLTEAWGRHEPGASEQVERILAEATAEIEASPSMAAKARSRAKVQIETGQAFDPPSVRRKPKP